MISWSILGIYGVVTCVGTMPSQQRICKKLLRTALKIFHKLTGSGWLKNISIVRIVSAILLPITVLNCLLLR
jgi:hypothetical protein